jgi:Flp pilus assembly pilin Flp
MWHGHWNHPGLWLVCALTGSRAQTGVPVDCRFSASKSVDPGPLGLSALAHRLRRKPLLASTSPEKCFSGNISAEQLLKGKTAMRKFMSQFWNDEAGFVISSELIFVATLLVIGLLTGLTTIRDQVLGELGDVADAISEFDQSYSVSAVTAHAASTSGAVFADKNDFCETAATPSDQTGGSLPQCLAIIDVSTAE